MKSRHLIAALALISVMLTLGSCSSKRKMVYFQDIDQITAAIPAGDFQIKIVPDDELAIAVTAPDQDAAAPYNMPYQPLQNSDYTAASVIESSGIQRRNQYMRYQPYKVSADGFINFPVLGRLHVSGMTPAQLAQFIEEKVADKVVNPIVNVDLSNFHINVIGTVGR
ncbi:MAG: polysaccharide biosynthesis/export family protein, partial [Muribaculaceae bacterium]|nr:polysaccharide biosynthesis/export family protein [Muribaculaceae bacterium]